MSPADTTPSTDALWAELHDRLLTFLARRVGDPADAEDLLHEVFVRVHARRETLRAAGGARAWVYQIARNVVADHHRRRARGAPEGLPQQAAPPEPSALDELAACVGPLVDALDEPYREALRQTDLGGATQREAAARAGISLSGMKSRVQRGRAQLRASLLACCAIERDHRGRVADYEVRAPGRCVLPDG